MTIPGDGGLKTLGQLAEFIDAVVSGDRSIVITGTGSIFQGAAPGSITFIDDPSLLASAEKTSAAAIIVPLGIEKSSKALLISENPKAAFARISALFAQRPLCTFDISPLASIHETASVGIQASIHPYAVISENVSLGNESIIGPGVFIGKNSIIGSCCEIHANAVIEDHTIIGNNVIIHGGSVIGADGFGFVTAPGGHIKMPQLGNVVIEDDVEIFANVTIARGTAGSTVIGSGSKLGDAVHIGHNAVIGRNCILVAQVVVGGSSKLGSNVTLAGKAGITDHVSIGNNVTLSACSIALKDIDDNSFFSGHPAMDHKKDYRIKAAIRRTPELLKKVADLERKMKVLEERLKDI